MAAWDADEMGGKQDAGDTRCLEASSRDLYLTKSTLAIRLTINSIVTSVVTKVVTIVFVSLNIERSFSRNGEVSRIRSSWYSLRDARRALGLKERRD